jgi:hypothetical protein
MLMHEIIFLKDRRMGWNQGKCQQSNLLSRKSLTTRLIRAPDLSEGLPCKFW